MNTIIDGLNETFIQDVVIKLHNTGIINLKKWFISEDNFSQIDANFQDVLVHWRNIICSDMPDYKVRYICPEKIRKQLESNFDNYHEQIYRESYFTNISDVDFINIIDLLINYCYSLIVVEKIELIIFHEAPHGAYSKIMYDLAKILDVKTLVFFTCFGINRTAYCWDLNDIGIWKYNKPLINSTKCNLNNIDKHENSTNNSKCVYNKIKKYENTYDWLFKHISKNVFNFYYKKQEKYYKNKYFKYEFDDNINFVYVPLHVQPEMTTATLGGKYYDQLLAIERLSEIIPENWIIYVKEHPAQKDYRWRGKYFFERLSRIPKVKCLKNNISTKELLKKCQFVSTITGTAGFEAINAGKPALVFGHVWYSFLPGVSKYYDGISVEEIQKPFDNKLIDIKLKEMEYNCVPGIVFSGFLKNDFNEEKNCKDIIKFLTLILHS